MKLYIYDHCPFCLKARMIFGLKNLPVELIVMSNDDEATPTRMIGQKMAPILQKDDSRYLPESMDIVHYVDQLDGSPVITGECDPAIDAWCKENTRAVFNLAIPRFTRADFKELSTPAARDAYTQREINAFGDLDTLMSNSQTYIDTLSDALGKIETYLRAKNPVSITDFYLFPILNSLTIVKDFPYSPALRGYLEHVSMSCDVPLFTDKAL